MGLHFIDQRVASDDARVATPQSEFQMFGATVPFPNSTGESSSRVWMYLDNTTLMVDGLGVGAAVIEPDITVTNGIVHIIGETGERSHQSALFYHVDFNLRQDPRSPRADDTRETRNGSHDVVSPIHFRGYFSKASTLPISALPIPK